MTRAKTGMKTECMLVADRVTVHPGTWIRREWRASLLSKLSIILLSLVFKTLFKPSVIVCIDHLLAELSGAKHASGAPWVRKWSNLPIRENLVITWPYTARETVRPHHRHTNVKWLNQHNNNNINVTTFLISILQYSYTKYIIHVHIPHGMIFLLKWIHIWGSTGVSAGKK